MPKSLLKILHLVPISEPSWEKLRQVISQCAAVAAGIGEEETNSVLMSRCPCNQQGLPLPEYDKEGWHAAS